MKNDECVVCHSFRLQEKYNLNNWSLVSSDCRSYQGDARLAYCTDCGTIQKMNTPKWAETTADIYETYQIYHQADGAEQRVFDAQSQNMISRSTFLLKHLLSQIDIPEQGRILDFGCGNGALLRSFHHLRPKWEMTGTDLKEEFAEAVHNISSTARYYSGDICTLEDQFDMITLLHCLEHITEPVKLLQQLREKLNRGGILFIQVPNVRVNPYDLLIFDHILHFTPETLTGLVRKAGFTNVALLSDSLEKEISLVASMEPLPELDNELSNVMTEETERLLDQHMQTLRRSLELFKDLKTKHEQVGIFGTSIAGTWMAQTNDLAHDFFVDEDVNRTGTSYLGKAILHPRDIPDNSYVFMPLPPNICEKIISRLDPQGRVYRYLKAS